MKGPTLAETITRLRPEVAVLYTSGHFEIDPRTRGHLPAGAQLLRKPFTTETLLQAVNVAIAPPVADTVH
jgi:FixJ family two-component response regulator